MKELPVLKSLSEFLLDAPLYQLNQLPDDLSALSCIYGKGGKLRFDGYCCECKKDTVYSLFKTMQIPNGDPWNNIKTHSDRGEIVITCGRNDYHKIIFYLHLSKMKIQKIGQNPSLADIANDELSIYKKDMNPIDAAEFHRAIGLAAHGIGVGSFVYLRRVFERLISGRFNEFKDAEGWDENIFRAKKTSEKIEMLKGHLPDFLVKNAKIYSILSLGVHELDEEKCLAAFDFLKGSIIFIVQEDKKKKEELLMRDKLTNAIAAFRE